MSWPLKQVHTGNILRMIHALDEPLARQNLQLALKVGQFRRRELELVSLILNLLVHESPAHPLCGASLHGILVLLPWTHGLSSSSELLLFASLLHLCCWFLDRALTLRDAESDVRPSSFAYLLSSENDLHSCRLRDV